MLLNYAPVIISNLSIYTMEDDDFLITSVLNTCAHRRVCGAKCSVLGGQYLFQPSVQRRRRCCLPEFAAFLTTGMVIFHMLLLNIYNNIADPHAMYYRSRPGAERIRTHAQIRSTRDDQNYTYLIFVYNYYARPASW